VKPWLEKGARRQAAMNLRMGMILCLGFAAYFGFSADRLMSWSALWSALFILGAVASAWSLIREPKASDRGDNKR
jgi:hypothetical protein